MSKEKQPTMDTVIIDGIEYDVTAFSKRHPGGPSILSYMLGQDATHAFHEFHYRSKKARAVLASLPKVPPKPSTTGDAPSVIVESEDAQKELEMLQDFDKLRNELQAQGVFKPDFTHVAMRILESAMLYTLGLWFLSIGSSGLAVLTLGLFGARAVCNLLKSISRVLMLSIFPIT
jgi:acyl-CoA 6-desaturase (Delta-6 desaturase)